MTSRLTYSGPAVVTTRRVVDALPGGLTGVSANESDERLRTMLETAGDLLSIRKLDLKGRFRVWVIVATPLQGRLEALSLPPTASPDVKVLSPCSGLLGWKQSVCSLVTVCNKYGEEQEMQDKLSFTLAEMEVFAARTNGTVVSVISASCLITWNSSVPCVDHVQMCALFIQRTGDRIPHVHCGAVTGGLYDGELRGAARRYATVVGSCVETTFSLALLARDEGRFALLAGQIGEYAGKHMGATVHPQHLQSIEVEFLIWSLTAEAGNTGEIRGEGGGDRGPALDFRNTFTS